MGRKQGFTLPELLTYVSILGIVGTFVVGIFVGSLRYYHAGSTNVEIQEEHLMGNLRLIKELKETTGSVVRYNNVNLSGTVYTTALIFPSARDPANLERFDVDLTDGSPRWHRWICYYLDPAPGPWITSSALVRKRFQTAPGFTPIPAGGWTTAQIPAGNPPLGFEATVRSLSGPGVDIAVLSRDLSILHLISPVPPAAEQAPGPYLTLVGGQGQVLEATAKQSPIAVGPGAPVPLNTLQMTFQIFLRN